MRRFLSFVLTFALAGAASIAAEKAKTPQDMDVAMKKVGKTQQDLNKAINAMAYADAKKQVDIMKATGVRNSSAALNSAGSLAAR